MWKKKERSKQQQKAAIATFSASFTRNSHLIFLSQQSKLPRKERKKKGYSLVYKKQNGGNSEDASNRSTKIGICILHPRTTLVTLRRE